jgi:hypothetical protein
VLNEVHAAENDWVELRNVSGGTVDLTGWSLTDDGSTRKFVFPGTTSLTTGQHLIVYCDTNSSPPGLHSGFGLGANSGSVFLYNSQTSRVDAISYGKQIAGYSIGRTAVGWELMEPTAGRILVDRPGARVLTRPERAAGMHEKYLDGPAFPAVHEKTGAFHCHTASLRRSVVSSPRAASPARD